MKNYAATNQKNLFYVNEAMPEFLKRVETTTFQQYSEYWLTENEMQFSPKTYARYISLLKNINLGIGHISLNKLASYHLNIFYKKLSSNGANKITAKGLSDRTILHHHRLISVVLKYAKIDKIITENVADKHHMKAPKVIPKEAGYLNEHEIRKVLTLLKDEPIKWRTATLLLLYTGMRRGELCGLEWKDIDFENKLLSIVRSSQHISGQGIITKLPKTKSSTRILKLSDNAIELLKEYWLWWDAQRNKKCWSKNVDRLFVQRIGLPMHPDSVTDWISKFCNAHKKIIPKFSPHSLRHTNVTLLIAANISLRQIASRVGHAQTSTTCNIYAHALKTAEEKAAIAINDALNIIG